MSRPELVVFDLGGTLVADDGRVVRCFEEILAAHGLTPRPEQIEAIRGRSKRDALGQLFAARGVGAADVDRAHFQFVQSLIDSFSSESPPSRPGAGEILRSLRDSGIARALTTGFPRRVAEAVLEGKPWLPCLPLRVTSDDVALSRPDPAMIHEAMRLAGVSNPSSVAKVGDTESDMLAGEAAGVGWNIALTGGAHPRERLESSPATHVVDSLIEAMGALDVEVV